jgi:hypothetical protein
VLSRVVAAAPAAQPAGRQTVVAAAPPRARSRRGRVATAIGIAAMAAAGAIVLVRPRAAPVVAPVATTPTAAPAPEKPVTPTTTTSTVATTPTATPATTPAPKERAAPVAMGTISVNASPWATVRVNGKLAGTTPILRFPVRAGRASVTIENPKLGRKQVDVKIEPKKDTPLIVDLRATAEPR